MKKLIIPFIIVVLVVSGIWYVTKSEKIPADQNLKTYKNSSLGLSFTYPKIITASTTGETVILHHEVPFVHHDYCDFKGEGDTTINTLTDFHVKLNIVNKNLVDTMKSLSSYLPQENFVNGEIVPSPGFIDPYEVGTLKGYKIFEGAEGCGHTIYYLNISENKTLVVVNDLITVFTGAIDAENQSKAEAVPGVLNRQKAEEVFNSVLHSLKIQ